MFAPWKKSYDKLSILKSRDFTLPTKVHLVKAMVSPVVTCGCESWTIKKAEHRRIDAFELWYWGKLLRVPWTARRSNQSIIKEISPEYLLEGLMLKLKLQYFDHLMWITDSLEKNPDAGKDWRPEEKGTEDEMVGWHHRFNAHEFEQILGVGDGQGSLACCSPRGCKELDMADQLNWTELKFPHFTQISLGYQVSLLWGIQFAVKAWFSWMPVSYPSLMVFAFWLLVIMLCFSGRSIFPGLAEVGSDSKRLHLVGLMGSVP